MRVVNCSFAHLFWLWAKMMKYLIVYLHISCDCPITKRQIPEFCIGYSDKTWYVNSGGQKYNYINYEVWHWFLTLGRIFSSVLISDLLLTIYGLKILFMDWKDYLRIEKDRSNICRILSLFLIIWHTVTNQW